MQVEVVYAALALFAAMNATGFVLMGVDKARSRKHLWRIPEKTLFAVAALGGGLGATAGMYAFRHKTKHWYFVLGLPALGVLNVAALLVIYLLGLIN